MTDIAILGSSAISTGSILKRTMLVLQGNLPLAAGAFAALTALSVAMDMLVGPDGRGNMLVSGLATVYAQYLITKTVMDAGGLDSAGAGEYRAAGFGAVFGVCFLSNLAIILGLLLLVVPGVFLAIRWFAAVPALIGEDSGVTRALGLSWERTKGYGGAIFGSLLVIYLPLIIAVIVAIGIGISAADAGMEESGGLAESLILNSLIGLSSIIGWHAAIAFWELRSPAAPALADVFA
ncbi:hypothetical protein ACFB49_04350 [Sphingomonas sp. DBB INV C78]|uniref:glycerophosphoryl diester phosphodiesterase membrane domain-containing protein n=1 Tax=Sphingomonas sp. DBB INV C78 TaxID=3349434 RepID=UPI0036D3E76B